MFIRDKVCLFRSRAASFFSFAFAGVETFLPVGFSLVFQFMGNMWHSRPRLCILVFVFLFRFSIMRRYRHFSHRFIKSCRPERTPRERSDRGGVEVEPGLRAFKPTGEIPSVAEGVRRTTTLFRAPKPHQGILSKDPYLICAHLRKSATSRSP